MAVCPFSNVFGSETWNSSTLFGVHMLSAGGTRGPPSCDQVCEQWRHPRDRLHLRYAKEHLEDLHLHQCCLAWGQLAVEVASFFWEVMDQCLWSFRMTLWTCETNRKILRVFHKLRTTPCGRNVILPQRGCNYYKYFYSTRYMYTQQHIDSWSIRPNFFLADEFFHIFLRQIQGKNQKPCKLKKLSVPLLCEPIPFIQEISSLQIDGLWLFFFLRMQKMKKIRICAHRLRPICMAFRPQTILKWKRSGLGHLEIGPCHGARAMEWIRFDCGGVSMNF